MKAFGSIFSVTFILLACISSSLAQRIMVESAYYGAPDRGRNVTADVQRFADYGEPFRVSNDTFRMDPAPGKRRGWSSSTVSEGVESGTASMRETSSISAAAGMRMQARATTDAQYRFSTQPMEPGDDMPMSPALFRILC